MLLRQEGGGGRPNFGHGGRMRTHAQVGSSAPTTRTAQRAIPRQCKPYAAFTAGSSPLRPPSAAAGAAAQP
jgi:hypothetical protein